MALLLYMDQALWNIFVHTWPSQNLPRRSSSSLIQWARPRFFFYPFWTQITIEKYDLLIYV